jgi:hypothetical protein
MLRASVRRTKYGFDILSPRVAPTLFIPEKMIRPDAPVHQSNAETAQETRNV